MNERTSRTTGRNKQKHFWERRDNTGDVSAAGIPTMFNFCRIWSEIKAGFATLLIRQLFPGVSIPLAAPARSCRAPRLRHPHLPERSREHRAPAAPPRAMGSRALPAGTGGCGLPHPQPRNLENGVAILAHREDLGNTRSSLRSHFTNTSQKQLDAYRKIWKTSITCGKKRTEH